MTEYSEYMYENFDAAEITAEADYRAARREYNDYVEPDDALVTPAFACPKCGEADPDNLIVTAHDAHIECATCGNVYTIAAPAPAVEYPVKPDGMTAEEWDEYQEFLTGPELHDPVQPTDELGAAITARIESILAATWPRRFAMKPGHRVFLLEVN
jgi:ribosomal protein S27AE